MIIMVEKFGNGLGSLTFLKVKMRCTLTIRTENALLFTEELSSMKKINV